MKKPKILVAIPTRGNPCVELFRWCMKMKERSIEPETPWEMTVFAGKAGHQNPTNNKILNAAFEQEWDYYLKIDDDLVPDDDLIDRLVKMDKDIVGVGVAIWREALNGILIAASRTDHQSKKYVRVPLETEKQGAADYVGGGCMMVKRHVLEKMKNGVFQWISPYIYGNKEEIFKNKTNVTELSLQRIPVWRFEYNDEGFIELGSDELFCRKAKDLGFEIWYDCTHILEQHTDLLVGGVENNGIVAIDIHQNSSSLGKKRLVNTSDLEEGKNNVSTRWESDIEEVKHV
jgi:hypothetical protein